MRTSNGLLLFSRMTIGIKDNMFGRKVALKKRELEATAGHFSREERAAMIQKFEEMDAAEMRSRTSVSTTRLT